MRLALLTAAALACAGLAHATPPPPPDPTGIEGHAFSSLLGKFKGVTAQALVAEAPAPPTVAQIDFDVRLARFHDLVLEKLPLSDAQRDTLARQGVVVAPQGRRYSHGSAYHWIYTQDLPVFVSVDSMLHAWHRSFDQVLSQLESQVFATLIYEVAWDAREQLKGWAQGKLPAESQQALRDAELFLTVALNLVRGSTVVSGLDQDAEVKAILAKIGALTLEQRPATALYGGLRAVDYSQFKPRGHYTKTAELQQYFRAMMWLGRADTGFSLVRPPTGSQADVPRERRAALALALALDASGGRARLAEMRRVIDLLVGPGDELSPEAFRDLAAKAGIDGPADLASAAKAKALLTQIKASGAGTQRINSQVLVVWPGDPKSEPAPLFQFFGQRFLLDSFVMSKVVFDQVPPHNGARRWMPTGLDVMASLGSGEALRLLADELTTYGYAPHLKTLRALVAGYRDPTWQGTIYNRWLSVLRRLNQAPQGEWVPQAMRSEAWRRKTLRTQLASWAELRHDTVLYGKQSYTAMLGCEYPAGYVEPVPAAYRELADMAEALATVVGGAKLDSARRPELKTLVVGVQRFAQRYAKVQRRLARLADLELAGEPFPKADRDWLKKTIDKRGGGSGPPRYDGWYTTLFYGVAPDEYAAEIADVHTDPNGPSFLEVATGDVELMVIAVDSGDDRALYVGPVSSYYEFAARERLTDQQWQWRIRDGKAPPPPAWTAPLFK